MNNIILNHDVLMSSVHAIPNMTAPTLRKQYEYAKWRLDIQIALQRNVDSIYGRLSKLNAETPDMNSPLIRERMDEVRRLYSVQ